MTHYYLQDTRKYNGNFMLWWKEGNNGYTPDVAEARIFTEPEAREKLKSMEGATQVPSMA